MEIDEGERIARLRFAQERAKALFDEIARSGIVRAGRTEREIDADVLRLCADVFDVAKHWHKRVVRSGPNTLASFSAKPPDRKLDTDDIAYIDLGPVFSEWEADFGRTFVIGEDAEKLRLVQDGEQIFAQTREWYAANADASGADVFAAVKRIAAAHGRTFSAEIAGHLIGEFPHARIEPQRRYAYIVPGNDAVLSGIDATGRRKHWILEVKLVHASGNYAAFYEDFLAL